MSIIYYRHEVQNFHMTEKFTSSSIIIIVKDD